MKNVKQISLLALFLLSTFQSVIANSREVLFIGNSYIYVNDLPNMIKQIAASFNDTLIYSQSTPGGYTLEAHSTYNNTLNAIKQAQWDVVILQEQSQRPSFSPAQVASDTYPYAKLLDSLILKNNPCSETMFYMTWGRKNGDATNCPFYPPVCTYDGMQQRLRESYMEMAKDNKGVVSPVGAAFKIVRDSLPGIDLYNADESHPSVAGTYLAACVFYASLFHHSPIGTSFTAGLTTSDAQKLQYYASKVTIDSMDQWQTYGNYTRSNFNYSINNKTATFQNNSAKATSYKWAFGDGATSTQNNPTHVYSSNGQYTVTLTSSNNCFSETRIDTITVGSVSTRPIEIDQNPIKVLHSNSNDVIIELNGNYFEKLTLYNSVGQLIKELDIHNQKNIKLNDLSSGLYIYTLTGKERLSKGKFNAVR